MKKSFVIDSIKRHIVNKHMNIYSLMKVCLWCVVVTQNGPLIYKQSKEYVQLLESCYSDSSFQSSVLSAESLFDNEGESIVHFTRTWSRRTELWGHIEAVTLSEYIRAKIILLIYYYKFLCPYSSLHLPAQGRQEKLIDEPETMETSFKKLLIMTVGYSHTDTQFNISYT